MNEDYASRHRANVQEVEEFLQQLGKNLQSQVDAYLIGGCNMALRGLKDATKDMDAIVDSRAERLALEQVMRSMDYEQSRTDPFRAMVPREYDGFRGDLYHKKGAVGLDVFERVVMDKFHLTDGMKQRVTEVRRYGNLGIHLLSVEDICLFKAITYRPDDDDDVLRLIAQGLDVATMADALREQPARQGTPWPAHVANELRRLSQRTGIEIPWIHQLD